MKYTKEQLSSMAAQYLYNPNSRLGKLTRAYLAQHFNISHRQAHAAIRSLL